VHFDWSARAGCLELSRITGGHAFHMHQQLIDATELNWYLCLCVFVHVQSQEMQPHRRQSYAFATLNATIAE
jgi:hypothetical protein